MYYRYVVLTVLQTLYSYFVEGDIVFVGRRKTFSKRVRLLFPMHAFLISLLLTGQLQIITERLTLSSTTKPASKSTPPAYSLSLTYVRSTSGGKVRGVSCFAFTRLFRISSLCFLFLTVFLSIFT